MKESSFFNLILVGLLLVSCQSPESNNPITQKINLQLDSLMAAPEFNALSVTIIDGEDNYFFHKGELLNGERATNETFYEIASITKTFTGTLLAYAINEDKVNIDDDIREYLTDSFPNLEYNNKPSTFRHLVTHQSSLPNMFPDKKDLFNNPDWDKLPFELNELQEGFSKEDFFTELRKVKIDTLPGVNFSYF